MTKIFYLRLAKSTLGQLGLQRVSSENLEYQSQMLNMLLRRFAVDKNIIKENKNKFPKIFGKDGIHEFLKGCWGIA
jgi:hypothetical protein